MDGFVHAIPMAFVGFILPARSICTMQLKNLGSFAE
jgi:hypothetical protein